jgi:26S proteasome non-ATPase regulatory subunit 9
MGFKMDNLHLPTVGSSASANNDNGTDSTQSFQELIKRKENLEAELSALGSVLDSVLLITCHEKKD